MKKKVTKKTRKPKQIDPLKPAKRNNKGKQHPLRARSLGNIANALRSYGPNVVLTNDMLASVLESEMTQVRTILR